MAPTKLKTVESSSDPRLQRALLAIITVVLASVGTLIHFIPSLDPGGSKFLSGMLWKVAILLGILWIAAPQLERLGWQRVRGALLVGIIIVIILYAIRPRIGSIAVIILIAISAFTTALGWIRQFAK
ncbi:MAG: hypothetical protein U0930_11005 [Pirellulales bacterium]